MVQDVIPECVNITSDEKVSLSYLSVVDINVMGSVFMEPCMLCVFNFVF